MQISSKLKATIVGKDPKVDVAVLKVETGDFGFIDTYGAKLRGNRKLSCELTLRDGKVVYDLNGITRPDWETLPRDYTGDAIAPAPRKRP